MSLLWTDAALRGALGGRVLGVPPSGVDGVSIDTRTLARNDLYFAIKGEVHDGHDFVRAAFAAGAGAAVVDEAHAAALADAGPLYAVPDVLEAMVRLGRAARARTHARIVAVTGSVGKTSTKEALLHVLADQGRAHASVASYNNHWGVPLTLARMPADTQFGIFEIGMSNPFEILPLTAMVQPHVAIITTVEAVHLAQFPSVAAIADAKGEIFSGLLPGGTAVLFRDNPYFERQQAHARASAAGRIVTFGAHQDADIRLERTHLQVDLSVVEASVQGTPATYRLGTPGKHMAMNSLAVLAAVQALGGDLALAILALAKLVPASGRGARQEREIMGGHFTLIDESFNANPASMRAALELLGQATVGLRGRRIAVLGDMLELGEEAEALHEQLLEPLVANHVDLVFASGPLMKALWRLLPAERRGAYASVAAELQDSVIAGVRPGDVVMLKGSKGSLTSKIVAALTSRFPKKPTGEFKP